MSYTLFKSCILNQTNIYKNFNIHHRTVVFYFEIQPNFLKIQQFSFDSWMGAETVLNSFWWKAQVISINFTDICSIAFFPNLQTPFSLIISAKIKRYCCSNKVRHQTFQIIQNWTRLSYTTAHSIFWQWNLKKNPHQNETKSTKNA